MTDDDTLIETGPYLTDPDTIQSVASRLTEIAGVQFVLVARSTRRGTPGWTIVGRLAAASAILVAAMLFATLIDTGWSWSAKTFGIWIVLMIPWLAGAAIYRAINRRKPSETSQRHDERIYALTGTHLHRISLERGRETRKSFALARSEYSARQMAGHTVSYALRFTNGGIDLMHVPYAPEVDRILMQPVEGHVVDRPVMTDALADAA